MKELKIQIPEGYEIDKEKSTFEKIVFKPIDNKPRSWEEYRAKVPENKLYKVWGVVEGKELTEAFLAMMKLMSLRQAWIGDWEPDWSNDEDKKWCITFCNCKLRTDFFMSNAAPLSFPTKEMVIDFKNCFKDLLEQAKILL